MLNWLRLFSITGKGLNSLKKRSLTPMHPLQSAALLSVSTNQSMLLQSMSTTAQIIWKYDRTSPHDKTGVLCLFQHPSWEKMTTWNWWRRGNEKKRRTRKEKRRRRRKRKRRQREKRKRRKKRRRKRMRRRKKQTSLGKRKKKKRRRRKMTKSRSPSSQKWSVPL